MYLLSNGVKIISFIADPQLIRHILEHLGLWVQRPSRDPPSQEASHENGETPLDVCYLNCISLWESQDSFK